MENQGNAKLQEYKFASHDNVQNFLNIAKRHLRYIKKSCPEEPGKLLSKLKVEHAIVASIFSATAVEAGLNLFISLPILFIRDENIRRFFGTLVTKYSRLSIRQKIDFSCEFGPQIKKDKDLVERVNALFDYRNKIMHSSQKYIEPLGLPDDLEGLPREISEEELIPYPQLMGRGLGTYDLDVAFQHYQTALDFLGKLTLYSPANRSEREAGEKSEDQ